MVGQEHHQIRSPHGQIWAKTTDHLAPRPPDWPQSLGSSCASLCWSLLVWGSPVNDPWRLLVVLHSVHSTWVTWIPWPLQETWRLPSVHTCRRVLWPCLSNPSEFRHPWLWAWRRRWEPPPACRSRSSDASSSFSFSRRVSPPSFWYSPGSTYSTVSRALPVKRVNKYNPLASLGSLSRVWN